MKMNTITSDLFLNINNKSISKDSSKFTFAFYETACHTNPGENENDQGQVYIFCDSYFKCLVNTYCFEIKMRYSPKCLFQSPLQLFSSADNLHMFRLL